MNTFTAQKNILLKKYIPFVLLGLIVYCSSCCHSDSCVQVKGIPVSFSGFKAVDLDTIYTVGYEKVTGFTKIVRDTVVDTIQRSYSNDSMWALKTRAAATAAAGELAGSTLSGDYNWEIYIPSVKKRIHLSSYTYLSYTCHSCPRGNNEWVESLASVAINGEHVGIDAVVIYY